MHTSYGDMELNIPRDRNGEFEPQIIQKHQNTLTQDMEAKILSMYAKGTTQADIRAHFDELYGINLSESMHFHVRNEGRIIKKAVYIALGIDMDGKKDILGMYVGENESAKFWLSVLNGLRNRGVKDILIACIDGLAGFVQAIEAVFPETEVQRCIIHQIRYTTKFVSYKDIKAIMADLKRVYTASTEDIAKLELEAFSEKWDDKYPTISKSWRENWASLSTYFKYPEEVRKIIYTTNTAEGFNRQLCKVTKNRSVFPNDDSLLKMLFYVMEIFYHKRYPSFRAK